MGDILWLEGFLGFELRVAQSQLLMHDCILHFGEAVVPAGECGPCPVVA